MDAKEMTKTVHYFFNINNQINRRANILLYEYEYN